jgi:hypothetical protein
MFIVVSAGHRIVINIVAVYHVTIVKLVTMTMIDIAIVAVVITTTQVATRIVINIDRVVLHVALILINIHLLLLRLHLQRRLDLVQGQGQRHHNHADVLKMNEIIPITTKRRDVKILMRKVTALLPNFVPLIMVKL